MQPIERQYLEFVKRFGRELERAEERYRDEALIFGEDPDSVCLSRRGAFHFLGVQKADETFFAASRFAEQLQAWSAYGRYRQLYVIDDALAAALAEATWPEALDVSSLFLPVPGAALSLRLPGAAPRSHFVGFYDLLPVEGGQQRELRFAQVHEDGTVAPCGFVRLEPGSLAESLTVQEHETREYIERRRMHVGVDAVGAELERGVVRLDEAMRWRGQLLRQLLNVLLYIHGNRDVVARVHPGKRPERERSSRARSRRRSEMKEATAIFDVGREFASTLRHWEDEEQDAREDGAFAEHGVRPHVRRAHLHLYWTGRGREVPRFQLVRPTLVRGGGMGDVTARRVC